MRSMKNVFYGTYWHAMTGILFNIFNKNECYHGRAYWYRNTLLLSWVFCMYNCRICHGDFLIYIIKHFLWCLFWGSGLNTARTASSNTCVTIQTKCYSIIWCSRILFYGQQNIYNKRFLSYYCFRSQLDNWWKRKKESNRC